jgi:hypothetical protein
MSADHEAMRADVTTRYHAARQIILVELETDTGLSKDRMIEWARSHCWDEVTDDEWLADMYEGNPYFEELDATRMRELIVWSMLPDGMDVDCMLHARDLTPTHNNGLPSFVSAADFVPVAVEES